MLGSCFVENIGNLLTQNKYNTSVNPFGVIYNPISVGNSLQILIDNKQFTEEDLNFSNELFFSYSHHGSFSHKNADECLKKINAKINTSSVDLAGADLLFVTFGTAWVYELTDSGEIVSNCHKQPESIFNRYRLDVDEIVCFYKKLTLSLSLFNPQLKIVFTVSPIRHWKDGAHGNQLSKSTLLLAVDQLVQLFDHVSYFPSYEIVMDELRDYRFYHEDMIHMNSTSVKYIWDRFTDTFMEKHTLDYMKKIQKIISAAHHRPFNPNTESHQNFIQSTFLNMEMLEKQLPNLSFGTERKLMRENLI
jgi:hypothetical protein